MKTVLIIGLGRFGSTMAMKLHELGHEVMAIDTSEERINAVLPYVTSAQIGDCANEQYMSSLGIRNFDVCVVAIGDNFQSSLEITSLLKDLGAKFVLSRASRDIHAKFLLRNGADQVVYPEKEMAVRSAVRYSSDNIFDYIELTQEHSIYEIPVPDAWVGRSIVDMNVRNKYNITILAIKYSDTLHPLPGASYVFKPGDILVILGANRDINRFVH
ncbi:TrkA family potassium uptake protein [uncultured Clostridium sp.]|uniref:potassium channel family protein n=1 Tax=uncultured Clostridium sp. TaxID=59620 RepID=UPI0025F5C5D0|nr:TrkA family potassium uptake protein [uncultured Clostridium sp.]